MHPENIRFITVAIASGTLFLTLGLAAGWFVRSLFIARELQRISREAWKQARIHARHGGEL